MTSTGIKTEEEKAKLEKLEKELREDVLIRNSTGNLIILLSSLALLASLFTGTLVTIGRSGISEISFSDSPKLFILLFLVYGAGFVTILRRLWYLHSKNVMK